MPFARCPICGTVFHLSVRHIPLEEWFATVGRERDADGTPLLKCARCWWELKPGHHVIIRALPEKREDLSVGQRGVVESVTMDDERGSSFEVSFGSIRATFKREDLLYDLRHPPRT